MDFYQASTMTLLQSELIEHQKILDAFAALPKAVKQHILTFHKSSIPIIAKLCDSSKRSFVSAFALRATKWLSASWCVKGSVSCANIIIF